MNSLTKGVLSATAGLLPAALYFNHSPAPENWMAANEELRVIDGCINELPTEATASSTVPDVCRTFMDEFLNPDGSYTLASKYDFRSAHTDDINEEMKVVGKNGMVSVLIWAIAGTAVYAASNRNGESNGNSEPRQRAPLGRTAGRLAIGRNGRREDAVDFSQLPDSLDNHEHLIVHAQRLQPWLRVVDKLTTG